MEEEFESEIRILEVDKNEVISKLEQLGAKKYFDGELNTRYFYNPTSAEGVFRRLRRTNGIIHLLSSKGSDFSKIEDHTTRTTKRKIPSSIIEGPKPRVYVERTEVRYPGDNMEMLTAELRAAGLIDVDWDKRRTTYKLGLMTFELEDIFETRYFGNKPIPFFVEIQTQDDRLTLEAVETLGHQRDDKKVVDWSLKKIYHHYANEWGASELSF